MTTPRTSSRVEPPVTLDGVPGEEDVSRADAARRVDVDPEEQRNRTDPVAGPAPGRTPQQDAEQEPDAGTGAEFPEGDRS